MALTHAELARDTLAFTVGFVLLHFLCRWVSQRLFSTYGTLSAIDKVRAPERCLLPSLP